MKCFALMSMMTIVSGLPIIRPATAPLQNIQVFDPVNYSPGLETSFYRESELKHGRLAMVGTLLLPLLEHTHSLGLGINAFEALPEFTQRAIIVGMFQSEFYSILKGWDNPLTNAFHLKPNYQPGDFGLGLWNPKDVDLMDKELNNGRLAMIGMLGMIVQEVVTQRPLF